MRDIWASDASDRSMAGGVLPVAAPPLAWASNRGRAVKSALRAMSRRSSHKELTEGCTGMRGGCVRVREEGVLGCV